VSVQLDLLAASPRSHGLCQSSAIRAYIARYLLSGTAVR